MSQPILREDDRNGEDWINPEWEKIETQSYENAHLNPRCKRCGFHLTKLPAHFSYDYYGNRYDTPAKWICIGFFDEEHPDEELAGHDCDWEKVIE